MSLIVIQPIHAEIVRTEKIKKKENIRVIDKTNFLFTSLTMSAAFAPSKNTSHQNKSIWNSSEFHTVRLILLLSDLYDLISKLSPSLLCRYFWKIYTVPNTTETNISRFSDTNKFISLVLIFRILHAIQFEPMFFFCYLCVDINNNLPHSNEIVRKYERFSYAVYTLKWRQMMTHWKHTHKHTLWLRLWCLR